MVGLTAVEYEMCCTVAIVLTVALQYTVLLSTSMKTSWYKWNPDLDGAAHAFDRAGMFIL